MKADPTPQSRTVRFAHFLIRFRWPVLLLSLAMVGLIASGGRFLIMNDSYRYFFHPDNPRLLAFDDLQDTYNKNDNILFVVAPKAGGVFTNEALAAVEELTREAWQIPFTTRVDSLTNFQHTYAEEDDLIVGDLVENAAGLSAEDLARIRDIALNEPLLKHRIIPEDGAVTAVNVTIELPGKAMGEQTPAVAHARELAQRMEAAHPDMDIRLTGFVMLNNAFQEASMHDMTTLVPLMYLIIVIVMALLLRSFSGTMVTLVVIGMSVMTTMGATAWLGIPLSPPSAIAPTLVMTLAVADCVHILVTLLQQMRRGATKNEALIESIRLNMQPIFLTSLTTIIGFLSLNFASVTPLNDLGNITSLGVLAAFVLSVTTLPALIAIVPMKVRGAERSGGLDRLAEFIIARRHMVLATSVLVVVATAALVPNNRLNDQFVQYFDQSVAFRQDTDFTIENLTGIYQIEFSLNAGEEGAVAEPAYLAKIDEFARWYRTQPGVIHVDTLSDTMKRLNKNMHADEPQWYILPDGRELAAQYLLLYEMSLPYGLDLNNRINVDKSATRFIVTTDDLATDQVRDLTERGELWLRENAPQTMHAKGSGPPVMFSYLSYKNSVGMITGTLLAFLLITLTLIIALRSLKYGLLSLIPNLVPSVIAFGLWGLFDGQINFGLTTVSALSIGIVVDDTVHFLSKYLRARRERGLDVEDAVRYAFTTVGRAMTVTTMVLMSGFLLMTLSSFDMNAGMGKLTAMTLIIALTTDFFMLPALLLSLRPREKAVTAAPPTLEVSGA